MVDDAFFILRKCGARAISTGSVQCAAALLGQLNDLLANQLRAALAGCLAGGPARLAAAAASPGYGQSPAGAAGASSTQSEQGEARLPW